MEVSEFRNQQEIKKIMRIKIELDIERERERERLHKNPKSCKIAAVLMSMLLFFL